MERSAEIIAIGSELLTPVKTDTNSLWLTARLNELGIDVKLKTVVGDDGRRLEEAVRDAMRRSDIVITTGGLGPTEDDITRQFAAEACGRELAFREDLAEDLRARFRRLGREMPEINIRQAYVIEGADVLPNPNGSAVGMLLEIDERLLVVLPGPPRELQPMFDDHVMPKLRDRAGGVVARRRLLRVAGMGESALDELIAPIYKGFPAVETSILFNRSEIEIHLAAREASGEAAEAVLDELVNTIAERVGTPLFARNGETMEEVVGSLLADCGETASFAESCTGGLVAARLTDVAGASAYFKESVVVYSNEAKTRLLGVPPETIEQFGAVSQQTAEAMAAGLRELTGADHAISVTGIAGPTGGSEEKPVGTVWIGYSGGGSVRSLKLMLPGDRYLIRWRASQAALDYLRRRMLKSSLAETAKTSQIQ